MAFAFLPQAAFQWLGCAEVCVANAWHATVDLSVFSQYKQNYVGKMDALLSRKLAGIKETCRNALSHISETTALCYNATHKQYIHTYVENTELFTCEITHWRVHKFECWACE